MRMFRSTAVVALAVAGSLVLASCGSDAGPSGGSGEEPVTIMAIATRDHPAVKQAELFSAAQARVSAINAAGGVNGRELRLIECDENFDPNKEKACVRQAVEEEVSAIVGSSLLFDQIDAAEAADIPLLFPIGLSPRLYESPVVWPTGGIVSWFAGAVMIADQLGIPTIAVGSVSQATSQASLDIIERAATNLGVEITGRVTSSLTATDLTSDAAALTESRPEAVLLTGPSFYNIQMVRGLRTGGYEGEIIIQSAGLRPTDIATLGDMADGIRLSGVGEPTSTSATPMAEMMRADIAAYGTPADLDDETASAGWSGVELFATVMADATSFTGKDVIAALGELREPVPGGVFGPFAGTGTPPFPAYPRLFSASFVPLEVRDGTVVPTSDFVEIPASVLAAPTG